MTILVTGHVWDSCRFVGFSPVFPPVFPLSCLCSYDRFVFADFLDLAQQHTCMRLHSFHRRRFPLFALRFPSPSPQRLVSCGRENVRFWRVRRRHLPACPAVLNDFARDLECTDLAFQSSCRGIAGVGVGTVSERRVVFYLDPLS